MRSLRFFGLMGMLAAAVLGMAAPTTAVATDTSTPDGAALLARAESLRSVDHPQFEHLLAQLEQPTAPLTAAQRWQRQYLEGWEAMYQGDYPKAARLLDEVATKAIDANLAKRAASTLMDVLGLSRRYREAYEIANRLARDLPSIRDQRTRFLVLMNLSQMLDYAGQTDLALRYARMMEDSIPPGESACRPRYLQAAALNNGKRLTLGDPVLLLAIDACVKAHEPVMVDALQLIHGDLYLDAGQPKKVLALLERLQSAIRSNNYYPHTMSAQVERAQALEKLGDEDAARQAALAVLAMERSGAGDGWVKDACEVLYRIEKRRGHAAEALDYYMRYVALDKAYLDDVNARAVAYEAVQQHVLAQKLETEQLARQNASLRLQQALMAKTAEANRLYIMLLVLVLSFGGFVMIRVKRSQLRFKRLSRHDGLTGLLNRQHFLSEAATVLEQLSRRGGVACLAYLDLDHFKRINDTHGHATGDAALQQVVATSCQHLRAGDLFGRLGGEEFGILLVGASHEQALTIAERIRQAVAETVIEGGQATITVSVSLGLAFATAQGGDLQQLCREADAALYRAKDAGRNRVETAASA